MDIRVQWIDGDRWSWPSLVAGSRCAVHQGHVDQAEGGAGVRNAPATIAGWNSCGGKDAEGSEKMQGSGSDSHYPLTIQVTDTPAPFRPCPPNLPVARDSCLTAQFPYVIPFVFGSWVWKLDEN